jgi:hypothetical protein
MPDAPWASGPAEILQHGVSLLGKDSDANRRLAMLSIDNAVELMLKTYLGLPKRVNRLSIPRREYAEFSESFPGLLDAAEKHISDKIAGIDLGEIEWYHRLRNQLYHQGNGLTVEIEKVNVYAQLAKLLFSSLFGYELKIKEPSSDEILGQFLSSWVELEEVVGALRRTAGDQDTGTRTHPQSIGTVQGLASRGIVDAATAQELDHLRSIRNRVVHGTSKPSQLEPKIVERLKRLTEKLRAALK